MRCLYCGKTLALLKRLTGGGEFCSDAHRIKYQEEYNQLALSRLLQAQNESPASLGRTLVPADVALPVLEEIPPPPPEPEIEPVVEAVAEALLPEPELAAAPVSEPEPVAAAPEPLEAPAPPFAPFLMPHVEASAPGPVENASVEPAPARGSAVDLPVRAEVAIASPLDSEIPMAARVSWKPEIHERDVAVTPVARTVEVREFTVKTELPRLTMETAAEQSAPVREASTEGLHWSFAPRSIPDATAAWSSVPAAFAEPAIETGAWTKLEFAHSGYEELAEAAARQAPPAIAPSEPLPLAPPSPMPALHFVTDPSQMPLPQAPLPQVALPQVPPTQMQPSRMEPARLEPTRLERVPYQPPRAEPQAPPPPPSRPSRVTTMPLPPSAPPGYRPAAHRAVNYGPTAPAVSVPMPQAPQEHVLYEAPAVEHYETEYADPAAYYAPPANYAPPASPVSYGPPVSYASPAPPAPPVSYASPVPYSSPRAPQTVAPIGVRPSAPAVPAPPMALAPAQVSWHGPALLPAPEADRPAIDRPVMAVLPPKPDTKPLPVTLHAMAAPAAKTALARAEALMPVGEPQVPRSTALPLRPLMYLEPVEAKAAEVKPEAKAPEATDKLKGKQGKQKRADAKVTPPEPAPAPKPEVREEPKLAPKPQLELVAEKKEPAEKPLPKPLAASAAEVDLGLPTLHLTEATESRWAKLPIVVKIGLAAAIVAAISGAAWLVMSGETATAGQENVPPVAPAAYEAGLPLAGTGWVENWTKTRPGRGPRLDILPSSMQLSDYRIEFRSEILSKATGWVYRAQNPRNYYAAKLEIATPGRTPRLVLARLAMIDGREERLPDIEIPAVVEAGMVNTVKFEAVAGKFTVWVQDKQVAQWSDRRIGSGGVGIYLGQDESATLRGVFRVTPLVAKN